MVHIHFNAEGTKTCYHYSRPGVNAANLTSQDIRDANANLAPFRQQRIKEGRLKATCNDPGYKKKELRQGVHVTDYSSWTKKELSKAILSRGIRKNTNKNKLEKSKWPMITLLLDADENPHFSRFLELPPELRTQIYNLALVDHNPKNKARVRPETPAISRVNRLIRASTLPLFFRDTCQTIIVSHGPGEELSLPQQDGAMRTKRVKINKEYANYFKHSENSGWLQHMRHFRFYISGATRGAHGGVVKLWTERYWVEFSTGLQKVETRTGEEEHRGDSLRRLQEVQSAMADITDEEYHEKFTADNFVDMLAFFSTRTEKRVLA